MARTILNPSGQPEKKSTLDSFGDLMFLALGQMAKDEEKKAMKALQTLGKEVSQAKKFKDVTEFEGVKNSITGMEELYSHRPEILAKLDIYGQDVEISENNVFTVNELNSLFEQTSATLTSGIKNLDERTKASEDMLGVISTALENMPQELTKPQTKYINDMTISLSSNIALGDMLDNFDKTYGPTYTDENGIEQPTPEYDLGFEDADKTFFHLINGDVKRAKTTGANNTKWHDIAVKNEIIAPAQVKMNQTVNRMRAQANNLDPKFLGAIGRTHQDMNAAQKELFYILRSQRENIPGKTFKVNRITLKEAPIMVEANMDEILGNPALIKELKDQNGNEFSMREKGFQQFINETMLEANAMHDGAKWGDLGIHQKEQVIQKLILFETPFEHRMGWFPDEGAEEARWLSDYIISNIDFYTDMKTIKANLNAFDKKKMGY